MHNPTNNENTLPAFTDAALEAMSNVIVTATEGGHYTRDDFHEWKKYKHGDQPNGRFYAEVTLTPSPDAHPENAILPDIRMTPEELGRRLKIYLLDPKIASHHRAFIARLLAGDEDVAGDMDVVDSGAILQIAVYGEVVFG